MTKLSDPPSSPAAGLLDELAGAPRRYGRFLLYCLRRFAEDGCLRQAAGLSYVSLLALVPLFAIALAILSAFPAFDRARAQLRTMIFETLPPESAADVSAAFGRFLGNTDQLTLPGLLALAVTAILLLSNINGAFGAIWRVVEPRPLTLRVLVYWAVLTMGPLLVGASLSLSSYAYAVVEGSELLPAGGGLVEFSRLIATGLAGLGFALLFFIVPNRPVEPLHALAGGFVAALLVELLKYGFGLYLKHVPAYQVLYGALAALPIFLVWMYLLWSAVLFGAELAAGLSEWQDSQEGLVDSDLPGRRLALALALLQLLRRAARGGQRPRLRQLRRELPATAAEIDRTMARLRQARLVAPTQRGRPLLARDLETVSMSELLQALALDPDPGDDWPAAVQRAAEGVAARGADWHGRSIDSVLREDEADRPA